MIRSGRVALTLASLLVVAVAACSSSNSTTADAGSSGTAPGTDAASTDAATATDAAPTTDASDPAPDGAAPDAGGDAGRTLTATSCDGLTPITTVHINVAGGPSPANIGLSVGDTAKWVNDESTETLTLTSSAFSLTLKPGEPRCLTFTFVGKFPYTVDGHASLVGSVEVQ